MIWAVIENHIAVVVACAPSIKVIILLMFPRLVSSVPRLLSVFTVSHNRYSRPADVEVPAIMYDDEGDARSKSTKDKWDGTSCESPLPSPMTPVFLGKWGKRAERGSMG
jgi:hypothetical protein